MVHALGLGACQVGRSGASPRILAEILYPESFEPQLKGISWEKL